MAFVARWGKSVKTVDRSDWVCDRSLNKVGLLKERDICASGGVVIPPTSGPESLTAAILIPASGPSSLSATHLAPSAGPTNLSVSTEPPTTGPNNLSANLLAPTTGPSNLSANLLAPTTGPSNLSVQPITLNIAPLESDQTTFADNSESGSAGEIKYSSDTGHLYIHDGTEWHHTKGRQPGEPYTVRYG